MSVLTPVMASDDKTGDLIAELAFARLMRGEYQQAIELYTQAIDHDKDRPSERRWQFARNIAAAYEQLGDTRQRDVWIGRSDQYRDGGQ